MALGSVVGVAGAVALGARVGVAALAWMRIASGLALAALAGVGTAMLAVGNCADSAGALGGWPQAAHRAAVHMAIATLVNRIVPRFSQPSHKMAADYCWAKAYRVPLRQRT